MIFWGISIDVTTDSMTIICGSSGSYSANNRPGHVRVFSLASNNDLSTDTWNQIGQDIMGEADGNEFGSKVSISEDGKMIAVTMDYNDGNDGADSGHIRIYCLVDDGMSWIQIGQDIDGEAAYDWLGFSESLSASGTTIAIGAVGNDGDASGQVTVYQWEWLGQSIYDNNMPDYL